MNTIHDKSAFSDLLQSLQILLHEAHVTQVTVHWGETDAVQPYNKLYFITEGDGWLKIGSETYHPKPGQLLLVPAHTQHSFSTVAGQLPYRKYYCHFNVMAGPFDLFQWIGVPLCIDAADYARTERQFADMVAYYHSGGSVVGKIREKQALLDIVATFLELVPMRVLQHRTEEMNRLGIIQHFVESRLGSGISIEQMAEAVHLHPNYFITYFKKHFGMSPLKYVNRKRTEHAKLLLTTTPLSIKEIADQTGFKETNHFTKFFRKETSFTPTDYRSAFTAAP
ncbi:AraC family transcriptional regulator [Paenibacillus radicis (ex Gao et al. 2016)]|uniref:Transcriptional regulator n=1 Tax=Paenibacillus radicis (ex Gao et al. 2016) TaxID=1737354 RepID=A0A917GSF6_9BACL|nr:AraC family transcriptional regulator [Paenibacillus radicis (ex Gao et al. 2016)]GGG55225.1 transcriptional regulator [Paenibacillus radicis (ex Gao et al. 2016)]